MKTYELVSCALLAGAALALQLANPLLGIPTGFGMTVDLVALPALLALFIFGFEASFYVLCATCISIAFFSTTGAIGAVMKFVATLPMLLVPSAALMWQGKKSAAALSAIAIAILMCILLYAFVGFSASWAKGASTDALVLGIVPILSMLLCALFVLEVSKRYGAAEGGKYYANAHVAALALIFALAARGIVAVLSNFFISGPLFFGVSPQEFVAYVQQANFLVFGAGVPWYLVIFFWNALQGAIEFSLAWVLAYKFNLAKHGRR